jgi:transcriptional regulator with XRE-family HTH domain
LKTPVRKRSVGEALLLLREAKCRKRLDIAQATGLTVAAVREAELADGEVAYDTLVLFLAAVGASWQDFHLLLQGRDPGDLAEVARDLGGALLMLAEQMRRTGS